MGKGKLLRNRQKRCENNGRPLQVSLIYRCRPALKAMNPVVLYGGYVLILIDVPQRVEVLLLAVVRRPHLNLINTSLRFCHCATRFSICTGKKLQCLRGRWKQQSVRGTWSRLEVRQSDEITPLALTKTCSHWKIYVFLSPGLST